MPLQMSLDLPPILVVSLRFLRAQSRVLLRPLLEEGLCGLVLGGNGSVRQLAQKMQKVLLDRFAVRRSFFLP